MDADTLWVRWLEIDRLSEAQWAGLEAVLDPAERQRAQRFRFDKDRLVYVAAHALGRLMLSQWVGEAVAAGDWRFVVGEHGKPELEVPAGLARLRLNLSHTKGLAAAALCIDHDVGVDVEWLGRKPQCAALAKRFFSAAEAALVDQAAPDAQVETFLALWTLKEAYVKAIGKGLAQPLDSFGFSLEPLAVSFAAGADQARHWQFQRLRPGAEHLLAVAVRHPLMRVDARPHGLD